MPVDSKILLFVAVAGARAATPPADSTDFFETRVRPVLATNCYACHTNSQLGGVRLDTRADILKVVTPGDPEKSSLILAIRQTGKVKMPMGGKLKPEEIADLTAWVKAGAVWPATAAVTPPKGEYIWTRPGLQDFAINSASEKRLRAYIRPRSEGRHPRALMEFALSP